jgi:hypothetical protein
VPIALPVSPNADENLNPFAQIVALRLRQILLFVLGEEGNQIAKINPAPKLRRLAGALQSEA